ncbi:MAG TPA: hypothetical protein VMG41_03990 [Gemmatimonadales bacterium]|nr:hypothetical protein [Gemmatimonadales bacterium]
MHTLKIVAGGMVLLAICVLASRLIGGEGHALAVARGALVFLPIWLALAGVNMWFGVTRAGYTVSDEAPLFLLVFAIPGSVALLLWWRYSRV